MVTVEFYGVLQEQCATERESFDAATVAELFVKLAVQYPQAKNTLARSVAAVNDEIVAKSLPLEKNQTVAVLPPVGGG